VGRHRTKDRHLPPRVYLNHGAYYYVSGGRWTRLSADLAEAKAKWADIEGVQVAPPGTMAALIARYLEEVTPGKAPKTQRNERNQAALISAFFGPMVPGDVRPMHVAQYTDRRGKSAPVAANREKSLLSHIFTVAMRWGIVDTNPCRGVRRHRETPRSRYVTDAEFRTVWEGGNQTIRDAMDLSYLTAQRIGDVLKMSLRDDHGDTLQVTQGKTGARISIQVTPALRTVLDRCRARGSIRGMTLLHGRGGAPYTYDGFSTMWGRAMRKSGVDRFTFHDLRAKALTDLERAGVPRPDIQALAGHASGVMTERYIRAREVVKATALTRAIG